MARNNSKKQVSRNKKQQFIENSVTEIDNTAQILEIASHYQEICDEIDSSIIAASNLVSKVDPLKLLQHAYGEYAVLSLNKKAESELGQIDAIATRMIDYVQCLIVSTPPYSDSYIELTKEVWNELKHHIKNIFLLLNAYFITASAKRKSEGDYDEEKDEFFRKAEMYWCFVKGDRHLNHFHAHLKSLLQPHDDVFNELFGISAVTFTDELEKIRIALTTSFFNSGLELKRLKQEFLDRFDVDELSEIQTDEGLGVIIRTKMEEYGYKSQFEVHLGQFFGLDLFDLSKVANIPESLLDNLAWSPGEEKTFLFVGQFKGWPLSLWPTWNKPFLKVQNKYYCFDMYVLSDKIYRAIQKMIYKLKPEYEEVWKERQQTISEDLPFRMLKTLLPGATCYKSVYYRWKMGQSKQPNWAECDGLILYDDHLFIIEVKAGAFTYTPPATDAPAYINSINDLLLKPAKQGQRFLDYLKSANKVMIYDKNHDLIGEISYTQFRVITICCVTIDQLTELAAKSSHLQVVSGSLLGTNVWNISIDDLRVYTDILRNPLQFLHFIEQRHEASKTSLIKLGDELEHLGLYLSYNRYAQHAETSIPSEWKQSTSIIWSGYTNEIDKYYSDLLLSKEVEPPQQKIPLIFIQILQLLSQVETPHRSKVASILLDMSEDAREEFANHIVLTLQSTKEKRRPIPFSFYRNTNITVYCNPNKQSFREKFEIIEHGLANIILSGDQDRLLLELFFNAQDSLVNIEFHFLTSKDIDKYGAEKIKTIADNLARQRIEAVLTHGKIGRNTLCPCGSGKKYKHCHEHKNLTITN